MNESNLPAEQIRQLWLGGDHATLIQMFRGIENQRVLSGDEAHYYGRSLLELGETDRAVTLLSHAENGCSEGFWASLYLGRALRASGRELDGLSASERAAGLTENNWYFMSTVFSELAKIIETTGNPQIRGGALAVMSSLFNSAHAMHGLSNQVSEPHANAELEAEIKRIRAEIPEMLGTSLFKLIFRATADSCFLAELNDEEFYIPRDTFRSNMHTVYGMHGVLDGPIKIVTETGLLYWSRPRLPPNGVFVDVGAMGGVVSLPMSRMHGGNVKVIAFEPARGAVSNLKRAITVNAIPNIELVEKAVSKSSGVVTFGEVGFVGSEAVPWLSQTSSILHAGSNPQSEVYDVETVTLDDFFETRPDRSKVAVIKIDVEGFEVDVIAGSMRLLKEVRPAITIDIHAHPFQPGLTDIPIKAQLEKIGYSCIRHGHVMFCEQLEKTWPHSTATKDAG